MLVKTKGIIFKSVRYRETSLILDIYTRELGLKTYLINGVRKRNARTPASVLQLMNLVELDAYDQEQHEINRIKEVRPAFLYQNLPFRIERSSIGLFMLEMVRKTIREKETNQKLYDFLESGFLLLDKTTHPTANFHIAFLLEFAAELGFYPERNFSSDRSCFDMREGSFIQTAPFHRDYLGMPESGFLYQFLQSDLSRQHEIKMNRKERTVLLERLIDFYRVQLGDFGPVRSLEVFRDIFQ
jgi:DNA repair protein RecO (recombination protein O)